MQKRIDIRTMQAIHDMFVCGLAQIDETYTDEQVEEICTTFDEMYNEFMYKCK